jgi:hypothetical protein
MCRQCSDPHFKLLYTPVEAALRWCGLQAHEHQIRQSKWLYAEQLFKTFPQWPCLATHVAMILDAIQHGELSAQPPDLFSGADGNPGPGSLRIRHGDLKAWMSLYHPDQKPPFLFAFAADAEGSVKWGHYLVLKGDRDTLQVLCERLTKAHAEASQQLADLSVELEQLRVSASDDKPIDARTEGGWLDLVGVMLRLLLDPDPTDKKRPFFASQDAIVSAIQEQFAEHPGLGKRTLDQRFADANKRFKRSR